MRGSHLWFLGLIPVLSVGLLVLGASMGAVPFGHVRAVGLALGAGAGLLAFWVAVSLSREALRKAYPSIEVTDNIKAVLQRADIDAAIVATPAGLHFEHTKLLLEAGKHVFVEKPLALSVAEAEELVALAREKGLVLMVGHTFLYNDVVRWIKDFIDSGELGDIYYTYFQG